MNVIRFAPGWSVPRSPDFWTYKSAWEIAEDPRGRLRIYDAFATSTWIHLNARVRSLKRGEKHLLVFEMSPQGFGHEVWQQLAMIRFSGPGAIDAAGQ